MDGVLRDTAYDAYVALCKTVNELGGIVPSFNHFVQDYESDFLAYYRKKCWVECEKEQIRSVYTRHLRPHDDAAPFRDVQGFLAHLQRLGVKVFAVSSHPTEKLQRWFVTHGIEKHFSCVFGGSHDKVACLQNACRVVDVAPAKAAYIGDWGLDMRAAKTAGLIPVGITRGYESRSGLLSSGAMLVIDNLDELTGRIR